MDIDSASTFIGEAVVKLGSQKINVVQKPFALKVALPRL